MKKQFILCTYLFAFFCLLTTDSFAALPGYIEVSGVTENYKTKDKDGLVDFSLIMPAMNAEQLINFDLGRIISPANDTLQILSYKIDVPSNLSLPTQTEKYFVSFTLDKPLFRAYLPAEGVYNMYALYGKFPIGDVVKGFQNDKSIFELVSFFSFLSGGAQTVPVKGDTSGLMIPVSTWQFQQSYKLKAPTYPKGKIMVSFSLMKMNDEFYPTDIKRIESNKTGTLNNTANADTYSLSVLMNAPQKTFKEAFEGDIGSAVYNLFVERAGSPLSQISYTLEKVQPSGSAPQFLPLIAAPTFDKTQNTLNAVPPQSLANVAPYATVAILSEVAVGGSAQFPIDFKKAIWTSSTMGWKNTFSIPANVIPTTAGKSYSWDVIYLGAPNATSDASIDWSKVSHVTRNTLKF